jgi:hypothetical protein
MGVDAASCCNSVVLRCGYLQKSWHAPGLTLEHQHKSVQFEHESLSAQPTVLTVQLWSCFYQAQGQHGFQQAHQAHLSPPGMYSLTLVWQLLARPNRRNWCMPDSASLTSMLSSALLVYAATSTDAPEATRARMACTMVLVLPVPTRTGAAGAVGTHDCHHKNDTALRDIIQALVGTLECEMLSAAKD